MTDATCLLVVDTGVAVVANGEADVSLECEVACVRLLRALVAEGHLVLDALDLIFTEYRRRLALSGQPGPGDEFMRWVFTNRYNPNRCTLVTLTPTNPEGDEFEEFEITSGLETFDRADRKFAAVAKISGSEIAVAVDRGWTRHEPSLRACGVVLRFICPDDIGQ